jgi:hypothetical protein
MKTISFFKTLSLLMLLSIGWVSAQVALPKGTEKLPAHPRLLCLAGQEKEILANIDTDPSWKKIHESILKDCQAMLDRPPMQKVKIGRRLLSVSRECLRRIFYLSYAYRTTKDEKYLQRAGQEMLAVAAFDDWNPSHFLDVAEMTLAMSIGYDWLYNGLPESSRKVIREAILKKGMEPSLEKNYSSWLRNTNNWNQVCNAGMLYGALATYEDHPDLSLNIINRAIQSVDLPMKQYAPDGAYPEGYSYWEYGTTFNVMLISALESNYGKDFGLTEKPGFLKTAAYLENMTGPSGKPYNYSDSGTNPEFNPAMFWFTGKTKQSSLLWASMQQLAADMPLKNRLLPAVMVWGRAEKLSKIPPPQQKVWLGTGPNPVALMRSSWTDPQAIFVGFKGGSPSLSHAHMDAGSFVMEADGVRWAADLGMQDYESLESKGVDLWNYAQNSQRWQIFRYTNYAHNTLIVNDGLQNAKGSAALVSHSAKTDFKNAVAELGSLYSPALSGLKRGIAIVDDSYVVVRDELATATDSVTVRWSMMTAAQVQITGKNTAELSKDGKTLTLQVAEPFHPLMKTWSADAKKDFDAPNPGMRMVGFELKLPPGFRQALTVLLIPGKTDRKKIKLPIPALSKWPE